MIAGERWQEENITSEGGDVTRVDVGKGLFDKQPFFSGFGGKVVENIGLGK